MKSLIKFPAMALGLFLLLTGLSQKAEAQYEDVSLQTFYDELSPYGTWINDPEYGYVWRPDVDQSDFRPYYSNGRWAMTEYGNTWVSNYEWGWAPFHYGRWMHNRYNNWVWIPDTTWGPAWVSWRSGGGNYGWAPLGPSFGVSVNIGIPDFYWNFIPSAHIYYNSYPRYYSGRNRIYVQNTVIINNTYVRNNRTYYTGPRANDIRRATNQRVTVYNINRSDRAGASRIDRSNVNIYAPRPSRNVDNRSAAPRQVVRGNVSKERVMTRENNVTGRENSRNNSVGNSNNADRNRENSVFERSRERSSSSRPDSGRESSGRNSTENTNRGLFGRSRETNTADATKRSTDNRREQSTTQTPRQERSREMYTPRSSEGRGNSNIPQRATERPQMQRTERSSSQPNSGGSRGSSNTNTERGSRGESSGRPGRG